jgi:hypothetical protein
MRRAHTFTLPAALGTGTACDPDEPTAPVHDARRPAADVVAPATVLGKATVDAPGEVGLFNSLALAGGTVHISHNDGRHGDLKYAEFAA